MTKKLLFALILVSFLPTDLMAQSLGDVAKKERKRREANRDKKTTVHAFTEKEIFGEEEERDEDAEVQEYDENGTPIEGSSEPSTPSDPSNEDSPDPNSASRSNGENMESLDAQASERRRQEAEWRARFAEARAQVAQAKKARADLDELHITQGEHYVDENGAVVIESLEHLRRLIREADQRVAAAEQQLASLDDRARRENVPPGWRR